MINIHPKSIFKMLLDKILNGEQIKAFWDEHDLCSIVYNDLFKCNINSLNETSIHNIGLNISWVAHPSCMESKDFNAEIPDILQFNYHHLPSYSDSHKSNLQAAKKTSNCSAKKVIDVLAAQAQATHAQKNLVRAFNLLRKCGSALIRAKNEQDLLSDICRLSIEVGGYKMAWVGFASNNQDQTVIPVAQYGDDTGYLGKVVISWSDAITGNGPVGVAIKTEKTVVNQNVINNKQFSPWREAALECGFQSSIALPLKIYEKTVGTFVIYSSDAHAFSAAEVSLLEELANDLAFGIKTLRMHVKHSAAEKRLAFLAYHDPLTGLPNRRLLNQRFNIAMNAANRNNTGVALLFLDLDNFKQINDSLGHNLGDQFLIKATDRLQQYLRKEDTLSRQGGDEFIILLNNISGSHVESIENIAKNIIKAFSQPIKIDGLAVSTTLSIGISLYPGDEKDFENLLNQADTALAHAKDSGRNIYCFFSEKMNDDALEFAKLKEGLRAALTNSELEIYYQTQIDIRNFKTIGVEALLRWKHPEHGMISPSKFIPVAERSGLIIPIGEWVLQEACRQAQIWRTTHHMPDLVVAVNLSAMQFKRGTLIDTVNRALKLARLPPKNLELELTESILLQDINEVKATLRKLKEIGVRLSIDDFGTGYSSLAYLKQLAVDKLKIDRSFVHDMVDDKDGSAIVKAIITLGHTLELDVIAEGVETEQQVTLLREYGVDEIQGYFFSRPLPPDEITTFINTQLMKLSEVKPL
ncbi:MAG: EAL domain-containing protein [Gammaproteobacteria bacterium]|nr:EAL domain-containing protein [Gammaproteobacteria bacterium]